MKFREPLTIAIKSLSEDGCGYSEDRRYAVFGSIADEVVSAIPISRKRKRLYLTTSVVHEASPDRVDPKCRVAGVCGGCVFQHLSPSSQLELKSNYFKERLAPLEPNEWLEPHVGSGFGYRSKARLGVKYVEKKKSVLVGFREKRKPFITDTDQCPIIVKKCKHLIPDLRALIEELSIKRSIPQVELAAGDTDVALIFRHLEPFDGRDLELLKGFSKESGFWVYLQSSGPSSTKNVFSESTDDSLTYSVPEFDLNFQFSPLDFTQVNLAVNRQMVSCAHDLLDLSISDRVLDAFCGIGNFSLALARSAGRVEGLELSFASVERAELNARNNNIRNVSFRVVDLHAKTLNLAENFDFNKVFLDPPRNGAEELVKMLDGKDVERVVYVSCNPDTFGRDAKILCRRGFRLISAGIIDMFPHTTHIESIALFNRKVKL